jgi:hypothetical protein
MPKCLFLCPVTTLCVQGFTVEEAPSNDPDALTSVQCLTCGQGHRVNFRTGAALGRKQGPGIYVHRIPERLPN